MGKLEEDIAQKLITGEYVIVPKEFLDMVGELVQAMKYNREEAMKAVRDRVGRRMN